MLSNASANAITCEELAIPQLFAQRPSECCSFSGVPFILWCSKAVTKFLNIEALSLQLAMEEWTEAKQALREQQASGTSKDGDGLPGVVIKIKELEDAVLPKLRGASSGIVARMPGALVIDCSKRASVFFRWDNTASFLLPVLRCGSMEYLECNPPACAYLCTAGMARGR